MDISDLKLIKTVADLGSISGASHALHLSQPTVSKRVARLEQVLGVRLFHRLPRGMTPTAVADYLLEQESLLNHQMQALQRQVDRMKNLDAGSVRLGVGPIIEQALLPKVLPRLLASTGEAQITVVTEDDQNLIDQFTSSKLDVIVGPFAQTDVGIPDLVEVPMLEEPLIAVVDAQHPLSGKANLTLESAMTFAWATPRPTTNTTNEVARRLLPKVKVFSDNYPLLIDAAHEAELICVGPRSVFTAEIGSGRLCKLPLDLGILWRSALLTRPEACATPLIQCVVDLFGESAKALSQSQ